MTYETDCALPAELREQSVQQGFDVLPDLILTVINVAMQIERQKHLGVSHYERLSKRQGYANGDMEEPTVFRFSYGRHRQKSINSCINHQMHEDRQCYPFGFQHHFA